MSFHARNLIDCLWQQASSGETAQSIDPSSQVAIGRFEVGGRQDAEAAVSAARLAFERPSWSQNPRLRQLVMLEWADRMEQRGAELARLLTLENGKAPAQARGEIAGSVSEIGYYAGLTRHVPGHVLEVEPGTFSTMLREPAGVAGPPWHTPAVLLIRGCMQRLS